jgi:hypothetical protein
MFLYDSNYGKSRSKPISKKYLLTGIFWFFLGYFFKGM